MSLSSTLLTYLLGPTLCAVPPAMVPQAPVQPSVFRSVGLAAHQASGAVAGGAAHAAATRGVQQRLGAPLARTAGLQAESRLSEALRGAGGEATVTTLVEVLEGERPPPQTFDKIVLVGQYLLEYTTALPSAVLAEVVRHVEGSIRDLTVTLLISDIGTMDIKAVVALRGGGKKVVSLHCVMAQQGPSPIFLVSCPGGDGTLMEVTYSSKSMLVLRERAVDLEHFDDLLASNDIHRASPKVEVWRNVDEVATIPLSTSAPNSLWRFGLRHHIGDTKSPSSRTTAPGALLLAAAAALLLAAGASASRGRRGHGAEAETGEAGTELTGGGTAVWPTRPTLVVGALVSEPLPEAASFAEKLRRLLLAGEEQPLWFRTADTVLTLAASAAFVLSTVQAGTPKEILFRMVEDVINVIFAIGFVMLYWAHDFKASWLFRPTALLDIMSCSPVISIFIRGTEGDAAAYAQLLQVFRFLRLLRETRIVTKSDRKEIPPGAEILVLGLGFIGLIVVSGTVLYIYESDTNESVDGLLDAFLYMSNIFTARPAPFPPTTDLGKLVTIVAFFLALIGIPFFVAELGATVMDMTLLEEPEPKRERSVLNEGADFWGDCLRRVDELENEGYVTEMDASLLRRMCFDERRAVAMVVAGYGEGPKRQLAKRLLECMSHYMSEVNSTANGSGKIASPGSNVSTRRDGA